MFITSGVEVKYFIENKNLEVNPMAEYNSREDFIRKVNGREEEDDWHFIFFSNNGETPKIDLTSFLTVYPNNALMLTAFSKEPNTVDLKRLRLYGYSEYIDSMFVIDMDYTLTKSELYRLTKVTVYDECHRDDNYKFVFKLGEGIHNSAMSPGYVRSLKLDLNRFELISEVVYEAE